MGGMGGGAGAFVDLFRDGGGGGGGPLLPTPHVSISISQFIEWYLPDAFLLLLLYCRIKSWIKSWFWSMSAAEKSSNLSNSLKISSTSGSLLSTEKPFPGVYRTRPTSPLS